MQGQLVPWTQTPGPECGYYPTGRELLMRIGWLLLLVVAVAGCVNVAGCLSDPAPPAGGAKPAGEVVVYAALDREFSQPVLDGFTRETGIQVLPKYDIESTKTVGLTAAIMAEANRPRCDVFWNNEILNTLRLEEKGLLEAYASPTAAGFPEMYRSPTGV